MILDIFHVAAAQAIKSGDISDILNVNSRDIFDAELSEIIELHQLKKLYPNERMYKNYPCETVARIITKYP